MVIFIKIQIRQTKTDLLDLKMPKVNGIEVLEKIKSHPDTKQYQLSSYFFPGRSDIKKCYELGANSYVTKPVGI